MGEGSRGSKPPELAPTTKGVSGPSFVPRKLDPSKSVGAARFDGIRDERQSAAAQIDRTLKAWRSASGSAGAARVPKASGTPLPSSVRGPMQAKLGADLSGVKIHTGSD